jgi:hypothetical protein
MVQKLQYKYKLPSNYKEILKVKQPHYRPGQALRIPEG